VVKGKITQQKKVVNKTKAKVKPTTSAKKTTSDFKKKYRTKK